jgi:short subunit dehydrogenase-like uncharacterized protein
MSSDWMIYGANGYTGEVIAREAARRGLRPTLAGRSTTKVDALAAELKLPAKVFPLDDVAAVADALAGQRLVLNCAGPFSQTAAPMIEACLRAGVHYLDITGEIEGIEAAAARDDRAKAAGVVLLPAVGFDVVPSDCLAAMLHERLPTATHLQLAFRFSGGISPGTLKTTLEAAPGGGRARIDGQVVKVPTAWKALRVPFPGHPFWAMSIPWGDVATAWYSTGIPNIETYIAYPRRQITLARLSRPLLSLLKIPPLLRLAQGIAGRVRGPEPAKRESTRAWFWGRVWDGTGRSAEATLDTAGGYQLTMLTALASIERVLAGGVGPGFATPSKAFGREFILEMPDTRIEWIGGG